MPNGHSQHGNIVLGHQAMGNIVIGAEPSWMARLSQQLAEEIASGGTTSELVEELQHFTTAIPGTRTLEEKLDEAQKVRLIQEAMGLKELFYKKLTKFNMYPTAQIILLNVLTLVILRFRRLVNGDETGQPIEQLILEGVVLPTHESLGPNPLNLMVTDVQGAVYYLTGNCHLDWSRP